MSKVLVTEGHLEDIADAIRAKLGVETTYRPGDMAAAVGTIPTLAAAVTGTKLTLTGTNATVSGNTLTIGAGT